MFKPQRPKEVSSKKFIKSELKTVKSPGNHSETLKISPQPSPLFHSKKFKARFKKESRMSEEQVGQWTNKVMTTDESNNAFDSNTQQQLISPDRHLLNEEYFSSPVIFKTQKSRGTKCKGHFVKLEAKLQRINLLVSSHQKELKQMRSTLSEKELHRLTKIHSIQKLKLVERVCEGSRLKRVELDFNNQNDLNFPF